MMNKSLSNYSDSTSEEANRRLIKLTRWDDWLQKN